MCDRRFSTTITRYRRSRCVVFGVDLTCMVVNANCCVGLCYVATELSVAAETLPAISHSLTHSHWVDQRRYRACHYFPEETISPVLVIEMISIK
jgi:hypothetical protein